MNEKRNRGSALILVVSVMLIVFATAAVSLNISRYEMLATNSAVLNANGYLLAEGGVMNAEKLFNKILSARFDLIAETAFEKTELHLTGSAVTDIVFAEIFGELMDADVYVAMLPGFDYGIKFNDASETEYMVTVKINYSGGVFEIVSVAKNTGTGVSDVVIGYVEFIYEPGEEMINVFSGEFNTEQIPAALKDANCYEYRIKSIKKAFEQPVSI